VLALPEVRLTEKRGEPDGQIRVGAWTVDIARLAREMPKARWNVIWQTLLSEFDLGGFRWWDLSRRVLIASARQRLSHYPAHRPGVRPYA